MNIVESSELWYLNADNNGPNAHDILGLCKARIDAMAAENVSSRQIADYLTERVSLHHSKAKEFRAMSGKNKQIGYRAFDESIEKIHEKMRDHIRSRFEQPTISDVQFQRSFIDSFAEEQIEKAVREALDGKEEFDLEIIL